MASIAVLSLVAGCIAVQSESAPPQLAVEKIVADPFLLKFKKESDFPVGSNWNGFVAIQFTPKFEMRTLPNGSTSKVDVSELTLKRGDKTITLVRGQREQYDAYIVTLVDPTAGKTFSVRSDEEVVIGSRKLRLVQVNVKEMNCTLIDLGTGQSYIIKQMAQPSVRK